VDPDSYPNGGCTVTVTADNSLFCGEMNEPYWYHLKGCRVSSGDRTIDCGQYSFSSIYGYRQANGCLSWHDGRTNEVGCGRTQSRGYAGYGCLLGAWQIGCFKTSWPSPEDTFCMYRGPRGQCYVPLKQPLQRHPDVQSCLPRLRD
jgi:hypothetical protein